MMMHYLETPRGVWYTQCQRHLGLHKVLPPVSFDAMHKAGPPYLNRQERRHIVEVLLMLRALKKHGGVAFSDFNTFLLRGIGVDIQDEIVVTSATMTPIYRVFRAENDRNGGTERPKAPPDDARRSSGQIVVEKYLEEHQADGNKTKPSTIMDGVAVASSNLFEFDALHDLLTEKVTSSLAGKLRDVAGFHVDKYDFLEKTADTTELREIARLQEDLTLAGEWQSLDTLLGAVVRLAVTANTTAELEPLFT
ncbi:hypothetical protein AM588_10005153 [Phytophthora nicotianae]|uniref:Uncharacterized protein n=1 Tax=Phytophthora nicotianae TaxID=4792 RepID=A0A0W8DF62_PHYNI|nr:hypothetical protein AM588_10005153 [Phytophthora nicotianae]